MLDRYTPSDYITDNMGCIFALIAVFTPRLALVLLWLLSDYVNRAFDTFIIPILGLLFLPFTTLIYVLVYSPVTGLQGFDWIWIILALMVDLASYGGSAVANKDKIPGQGGSSEKPKAEEKEDAEEAEIEEEEEKEEE